MGPLDLREAAERLGLAGQHVLVACSGGVDSVVLADALTALRAPLGLEVSIGHVHHGLRGDAADRDAAAVVALGGKLGVEVHVEGVNPHALREGGSSRTRPTLQEAARRARYGALRALRERVGADRIATAHHQGDQAETVLLRLLRGTGPDGLAGIPEISADGRIVRPLLGVPRAEIARHARERGLEWREDRSNRDVGYARNRLRHEWLPGLADAFNPALLRALGDLAEAVRRDGEWIGEFVDAQLADLSAVEDRTRRIDPRPWADLPDGLARRLVARMLAQAGAGRDTTRVHILRCVAFLRDGRPGSRIELPGDLELRRDRAGFRLGPVQPRGSC